MKFALVLASFVLAPTLWAGTANPLPLKKVTERVGAGCHVAMDLPDLTPIKGGLSRLFKGGFTIGDPLPKKWRTMLNELEFNLNCRDKDDPEIFHTYGTYDTSSRKWVKNIPQMRQYLAASSDDYERNLAESIITTTNVYDIKTINAHGWVDTYEELTGDERYRKRGMSFCLFRNAKALCGIGTVAYVADGPKGDLTKYALEILNSIEFLPDLPESTK